MQDRTDDLIKASLSDKPKNYNPLEDYSTTELKKELRRRKGEK